MYAGNDAIVAFARCFGASVVIHQLNAPRWEIHAPDPSMGKTLHVAYLNEEHYCSIQPLLPDQPLPPLVSPAAVRFVVCLFVFVFVFVFLVFLVGCTDSI